MCALSVDQALPDPTHPLARSAAQAAMKETGGSGAPGVTGIPRRSLLVGLGVGEARDDCSRKIRP